VRREILPQSMPASPAIGFSVAGGSSRDSSRKEKTRLFEEGKGVRSARILLKYLPLADAAGLSAGFIVRRSAGNAVRRNRIRRLLREAFRLRRASLEQALPEGIGLHLAFLWLGAPVAGEPPRLAEIDAEIGFLLRKLTGRLRPTSDAPSGR
jgi:ribonuclease P protein component